VWQLVLLDLEEQVPYISFIVATGGIITGAGTTLSSTVGAATAGSEKIGS
jgi:hypothetical protein